MESISGCFENVFITKSESIIYASFARLQADLNCLQDLVSPDFASGHLRNKKFSSDWKYFVNTASSEFPLRTNYEMARILDMYNGANDIEVILNFDKSRINYIWKIHQGKGFILKTKREPKGPPPHNLTIAKGFAYCLLSRKFVEHVLTSQYAKDLLVWLQDTWSPDEL